jgi:tetratricopeptide (TPR) repeat protein
MPAHLDPRILFRVVIPVILLPVLGIAARPHDLTRHLHRAQQANLPSTTAADLAWIAQFEPWRSGLWEVAGMYALQGENYESAIDYLRRAQGSGVLSAEGYIRLGDAYQQVGDLAAAQASWNSGLQAGAAAGKVAERLLDVHRRQGDYESMIADLQTLAALNPGNAERQYQLGLYLSVRQPEAALAHLAQAAELEPALKPKADALVKGIQAARRADDSAYTLLEAGRALAVLSEWELATLAFQQATQRNPEFADAWAYLGEARQQTIPAGDTLAEQGLAELEKALELEPQSLAANTLLALYWQRRGEYGRALQVMQSLMGIYPDNPALQVEFGRALAQTGDLEAALQAYQRAIDLAPRNAAYWRLLAEFSVRHEYQVRQIALPAARRAAALNPGDPANSDMLGQVLLLLEDLTSAQGAFQRASEADAGYVPAQVHLGLVYMLRGERLEAYNKWTQVLQTAPGAPAADQAKRLLENYFP